MQVAWIISILSALTSIINWIGVLIEKPLGMEDSIFKLKSIFVVLPTQIGNSTIFCPSRLVTKSSISIVLQGISVPAGRMILGRSSLVMIKIGSLVIGCIRHLFIPLNNKL